MSSSIPKDLRRQVRAKTTNLKKQILAMDLISLGTLHQRTKVCGKAACRCHQEERSRHGPYFEWTRYEEGKLLHSVITEKQARMFELAIANWREVEALLSRWRDETVTAILTANAPK